MNRRMRTAPFAWAAIVAVTTIAPSSANDEVDRALAAISKVGREGKANDLAGLAWKALVAEGRPALLPTLAAIDDTNPTSANWLRTAVDAIAEAETKANRPLPSAELEAFSKNAKCAPSARALAYEMLSTHDPSAKARLLPGFLDDRSPELRRLAVGDALERAKQSALPVAELERLFAAARDKDQVEAIAKMLEEKGKKASVTEHLAFLTHWQLVGPFASEKGQALSLSYPPETAADPSVALKGKGGADLIWVPAATTDRYATVDLNALIGREKNAAAYALAVVAAAAETPCEIRVASPNAVQIFLNGKKLFEREEYHHGDALDYHVGKGTLQRGENAVVVKVCQNNQTEAWALRWQFQARVCDSTGGPLPGLSQIVRKGGQSTSIPLGSVATPAAKEEKK